MKKAQWVGIGFLALVGQLVLFGGTAAAQPDACRVGQELGPGDYCTVDVPGIDTGGNRFEVQSDGRACLGTTCFSGSIDLNGFRASPIGVTTRWRIDALPGGGTNGFTDDPLVSGVTPVRAIHFRELRTRIDALLTEAGRSAYAWTDRTLTPGATEIRGVHLTELRTALNEAYAAAGQPRPAFTDRAVRAGTTPIRAAHVAELRAAVVELENAAPTGLMPDLVAGPATVDESTLEPGQSFTLSVTVRNRGTARADETTLRYHRSTDLTIASGDVEVGTETISALAVDASGIESIGLTAPTYYYGACVDAVEGESNTDNNCSAGVRVTVESDDEGADVFYRITRCEGTRLPGDLVRLEMEGTVRAVRAVTDIVVRGWIGDYAMRVPDRLGSIAAGETKDFFLSDTTDLDRIVPDAQCRVEVTGLVSRGGTTAEATSVSEIGPAR